MSCSKYFAQIFMIYGQKLTCQVFFFFRLTFLNENDTVDCFTEDLMAIKPRDDEQIDSFTDHAQNNYIDDRLLSQPPHGVSWITLLGRRGSIQTTNMYS